MKHRIKAVIGFFISILLIVVFTKQLWELHQLNRSISDARNLVYHCFLMANQIQYPSDVLLRMAPAYHGGTEEYQTDVIFHDDQIQENIPLLLIDTSNDEALVKLESNIDQILDQAGFHLQADEKAMLMEAIRTSRNLILLENQILADIERNPQSSDARDKALQTLTSSDHLRAKARLSRQTREFRRMVAERVEANMASADNKSHNLKITLTALGIIMIALLAREVRHHWIKAAQFERRAHHDPLTHAASRSYLNEYLESHAAIAEAHGEIIVLAFVDLNGFKPINDKRGHRYGDKILARVSTCLQDQCRSSDLVARYGGDEFVVVMVSPMNQRRETIQRMKNLIRDAFLRLRVISNEQSITAAAGISMFPAPCRTVENLLQVADNAMYQAKMEPSDPVAFCIARENHTFEVDSESNPAGRADDANHFDSCKREHQSESAVKTLAGT